MEEPVHVPHFVNVTPSMEISSQDTSSQMEVDTDMETTTNELPEGFFDDPVMDAKVSKLIRVFLCEISFQRGFGS